MADPTTIMGVVLLGGLDQSAGDRTGIERGELHRYVRGHVLVGTLERLVGQLVDAGAELGAVAGDTRDDRVDDDHADYYVLAVGASEHGGEAQDGLGPPVGGISDENCHARGPSGGKTDV